MNQKDTTENFSVRPFQTMNKKSLQRDVPDPKTKLNLLNFTYSDVHDAFLQHLNFMPILK